MKTIDATVLEKSQTETDKRNEFFRSNFLEDYDFTSCLSRLNELKDTPSDFVRQAIEDFEAAKTVLEKARINELNADPIYKDRYQNMVLWALEKWALKKGMSDTKLDYIDYGKKSQVHVVCNWAKSAIKEDGTKFLEVKTMVTTPDILGRVVDEIFKAYQNKTTIKKTTRKGSTIRKTACKFADYIFSKYRVLSREKANEKANEAKNWYLKRYGLSVK